MDALQLLTWSLILYLFASLASLFLLGLDRLAIKLSGITSLVGGVIAVNSKDVEAIREKALRATMKMSGQRNYAITCWCNFSRPFCHPF